MMLRRMSLEQELTSATDNRLNLGQPLLAPLALLKHHFREHPDDYVACQVYLDPHPPASALRRPL